MFTVTRKELADWKLHPDDLVAVANAWLGWFRLQNTNSSGPLLSWQALFEGFSPSQDAEIQASAQALTSPHLPDRLVSLDGPGRLCIDGLDSGSLNQSGLVPLLACIASPLFADLSLRIRLQARSDGGSFAKITVFGVIRDGTLVVKAIWQGGVEMDTLAEHNPLPKDAEVLKILQSHVALDRALAADLVQGARWQSSLRNYNFGSQEEATRVLLNVRTLTGSSGGSVSGSTLLIHATVTETAVAISHARNPQEIIEPTTAAAEKVGDSLVWLLFGDQKKRTLGDWGKRIGLATGVAAAGWTLYALQPEGRFFLYVGIIASLLTVWIVGYHLVLMQMYRSAMRRNLRDLFSRPLELEYVSFAKLGLDDDPAVLRFSKEVEKSGGVAYAETGSPSIKTFGGGTKIFTFRDEGLVFSLLSMNGIPGKSLFPAKVNFHLETRFSDGLKLYSSNHGMGFRKPLPDSDSMPRYWPQASTVSQILQNHRRVVKRLVSEGRQVAPLDPDDIIPRLKREHRNYWDKQEKYGWYTWADAFHEVFSIIRKDYLEP